MVGCRWGLVPVSVMLAHRRDGEKGGDSGGLTPGGLHHGVSCLLVVVRRVVAVVDGGGWCMVVTLVAYTPPRHTPRSEAG